MVEMLVKILFICMFLLVSPSLAAENALRNIKSAPESAVPGGEDLGFAPGKIIVFPDGSREVVESHLSSGEWRTNKGSVVSPLGVVMEGRHKDDVVEISATSWHFSKNSTIVMPDGLVEMLKERLADGSWRTSSGALVSSSGQVLEGPGKGRFVSLAGKDGEGVVSPEAAAARQQDGKTAGAPETGQAEAAKPEEMDIADILPSTPYPDVKGQGGGKPKALVAENGGKGSQAGKGEGKDKGAVAGKGEAAGSGKGAGKKTDKGVSVARSGDPLRIPEEAVNTGNLSFLEGCWQGTRPEYFTKRTVKECFCFNADGRGGKRRVYDITQGNRMCVGATRANLSRKGVLSVTSSGAVCNDGERWGAARMICRNSGPRTPCSWVFTDANNGTQAYEIPFIRVQSCGR